MCKLTLEYNLSLSTTHSMHASSCNRCFQAAYNVGWLRGWEVAQPGTKICKHEMGVSESGGGQKRHPALPTARLCFKACALLSESM